MTPTSPTTCTHDRGRGTTVCLRCRHDEWQAAQKRRQQILMRFLGLACVGGVIGVAGATGAITLRGGAAVAETSSGNVSLRQEGQPTKRAAATRLPVARQLAPTPAPAVSPPTETPTPPAPQATVTPLPDQASRAPLIGPGRTALSDSVFAVRNGDSVNVNFDTMGNRTRRADKLERMIRVTLPLVYGRGVAAVLDSIPEGFLLPSRDVAGVLTSQGLHLRLDNGVKIGLWPQTRESTDGPLVVAYLVAVER